jgi:hypothetical protein
MSDHSINKFSLFSLVSLTGLKSLRNLAFRAAFCCYQVVKANVLKDRDVLNEIPMKLISAFV